jgi:pimeloyl-ACP methyl ester carboxylesterase
MGTGTLLHAALKHPERFERLILTAPPTAWETRLPQVRIYQQLAETVETSTPEELEKFFKNSLSPPIFQDVPGYPSPPDVARALLPSAFRGAALSDLPEPDRLRSLNHPALILAWAGDPGHPESTAKKLAKLLPNAQVHISTTSQDIRSWGTRAARFLAA